MKIKQQRQIKEFLIKEFGNDGGNDLFAKQDKKLNEIIKGEKNKTESQMKTLAQTILPRIALYQVLLESELSQDDVNKSMRKYMLDVVAADVVAAVVVSADVVADVVVSADVVAAVVVPVNVAAVVVSMLLLLLFLCSC